MRTVDSRIDYIYKLLRYHCTAPFSHLTLSLTSCSLSLLIIKARPTPSVEEGVVRFLIGVGIGQSRERLKREKISAFLSLTVSTDHAEPTSLNVSVDPLEKSLFAILKNGCLPVEPRQLTRL